MRRLKKDIWIWVLVVFVLGSVVMENMDGSDEKVLLKGKAQIEDVKDKPEDISGDTYVIKSMGYVGYNFLRVKFKGLSSDAHLSDRTMYLYECEDAKNESKCKYKSRMGFMKGDRITALNEGKASTYFLDEGYYMVKVKKKVHNRLLGKSFYEKTKIFHFTDKD